MKWQWWHSSAALLLTSPLVQCVCCSVWLWCKHAAQLSFPLWFVGSDICSVNGALAPLGDVDTVLGLSAWKLCFWQCFLLRCCIFSLQSTQLSYQCCKIVGMTVMHLWSALDKWKPFPFSEQSFTKRSGKYP